MEGEEEVSIKPQERNQFLTMYLKLRGDEYI